MYRKSLKIKIKQLGRDHPNVATTQDNIGCVLEAQGKLSEALDMHSKALKTRVAALGHEHPVAADTLYNIAMVHRKQGQHNLEA